MQAGSENKNCFILWRYNHVHEGIRGLPSQSLGASYIIQHQSMVFITHHPRASSKAVTASSAPSTLYSMHHFLYHQFNPESQQ